MKITSGDKFGRLTILNEAPRRFYSDGSHRYVNARCECGTTKIIAWGSITAGKSRSCGCLRREMLTVHGMFATRVYGAWLDMKGRCKSDSPLLKPHYKDRGIRVCQRWRSFERFYADMGDPPPGMTLERIDNARGYAPGNCRWATMMDQSRNTRRSRFITYKGQQMCLHDACQRAGISAPTNVSYRAKRDGITHQEAFERIVAFRS